MKPINSCWALIFLLLSEFAPAAPPKLLPGDLAESQVKGSGPVTMLLIPCMSCRWKQFDTFMERNAARYTMHAVTLPGFGGTPLPDIGFDHENLEWRRNAYQALENYLAEQDLRQVVLVSHSFGTTFAINLAANHQDRVRALINIDGFIANGSQPRGAEALADIRTKWMEPLYDAEAWRKFNLPSIDDPERQGLYHGMFMATPREALFAYWSENLFNDLDASLRRILVPILDIKAIRGEKPEQRKEKHLNTLEAAGAPEHTQTIWFMGARHHIPENDSDRLDAVIADFLEGKELKAAY